MHVGVSLFLPGKCSFPTDWQIVLLFEIIWATVKWDGSARKYQDWWLFPTGRWQKGIISFRTGGYSYLSFNDDAFYEPHKTYKSLALVFFRDSVCKYKNHFCNVASLKHDHPGAVCGRATNPTYRHFEVLGISEKMLQVDATGKPRDSFIPSCCLEAGGWCDTVSTENRGTESRLTLSRGI